MGNLITSSLLDSIDWYRQCPDSWKEKAYKDLSDKLNRIYGPMNPEVQRGIDFEAKVCSLLDAPESTFMEVFKSHDPGVRQFWTLCHGGRFQSTLKSYITIDGTQYTLYGKSDILFPDRIVDIKTTANYKGPANYRGKTQHLVYIVASKIPTFTYLIAEFNDVQQRCIGVYNVDASMSVEDATRALIPRISESLDILRDDGDLWTAYKTQFNQW